MTTTRPSRSRRAIVTLALTLGALAALAAPAAADFGISSFGASVTDEAGAPFTQAGGHPYQVTTTFTLNTAPETGFFHSPGPDQNVKDIEVNLPPGLVGNPQALPKCTFRTFVLRECAPSTQVGTVDVVLEGGTHAPAAVYNMVPREGKAAEFAAYAVFQIVIDFTIRTGFDYGISAPLSNLSTGAGVMGSSVTIWGVPADPSHDDQRCAGLDGNVTPPVCDGVDFGDPENNYSSLQPHPAGVPQKPLLTLPTSCQGAQTWSMSADSWQTPGSFSRATAAMPATTGCNRLDFSPQVAVRPTTGAADSPSGLHFELRLPQDENPDGIAEAQLRDARVELPAGMVVDPSAAEGLLACSEAEIGYQTGTDPARFSPGPGECPAASKIGNVSIRTPLLDHPLPGAVYLARQTENPFGSLFALYLAVYDPISGVVVKLPGKVELDPVTGRLTTTFEENPQLPFEYLELEFFGGPKATLTTPSTCGAYTTTTDLTPWTSPEAADAHPSSSFPISSGANGAACIASEAQMANAPSFEAGTVTALAGSYSPFVLKVHRENGSQRIGAIDATLPEGLIGKLAGISYCSDAAIAQADSRSGLGQGAVEQADPSCPAGSEIGTVNVGAGSGSPTHVRGRAYLAGPYKGAPLSLVVITPAVAGPFDLGSVVIRNALYVDPTTTQIHAVSDPIPQILAGIPLDIRSIAIDLDRPNFTLNPTSCEPMAMAGATTSTLGQVATLQSRFQVGGCKGLGFKPKLKLALKGGTKRSQHPALKSVLTYPKGEYANISRASVTLPASEFIDQGHIGNPCIRPDFAAGKCPKLSVLGRAKAWSPLLDKPLEGKVYFRSNGGERELPDVVADLNGQIHVVLVGFVDSLRKKGSEVSRLRTTFARVPDAPVSRFVLELKGGKEGLLVNSGNLCKIPNKAIVKLTGQNGKTYNTEPAVANGCGVKKAEKSPGRLGYSHR
jgi:hypothetical protein